MTTKLEECRCVILFLRDAVCALMQDGDGIQDDAVLGLHLLYGDALHRIEACIQSASSSSICSSSHEL